MPAQVDVSDPDVIARSRFPLTASAAMLIAGAGSAVSRRRVVRWSPQDEVRYQVGEASSSRFSTTNTHSIWIDRDLDTKRTGLGDRHPDIDIPTMVFWGEFGAYPPPRTPH